MHSVSLRHTGITTSRLGFGCAGLTALGDRSAALRLLAEARDLGIRHFDVARAYGQGHAEGILGAFLAQGGRERLTIATKFGMRPAVPVVARHRGLVDVAKRLLRRLPALDRLVRRRIVAGVGTGAFSPAEAEESLVTSLRQLGTDRVDLLLLHECSMADARREDLLSWLEAQVARGTVRAFGIATSTAALDADLEGLPGAHRVIQIENSAMTPTLRTLSGHLDRAILTHSAVKAAGRIAAVVAANPAAAEAAGALAGDLRDPARAASLLLRWALRENASGVVLVGTTKPSHLRANVADVEGDALLPEEAERLERVAALVASDSGGDARA